MNLKELTKEVLALGFDEGGEVTDAFYSCANRALRLIYTEYPSERMQKSYIAKPRPTSTVALLRHSGGEENKIAVNGRALSFTVSGEGEALLRDGSGERSLKFNSPYQKVRELIDGKGEIIFKGDFCYTVSDFAVFSELSGSRTEDIPILSEERAVLMDDMTSDFLSFSRLPEDASGNLISEAKISGGTLILPASFEGEIRIYYNRRPKEITGADEDERIDVPEEIAHLTALLTASYLWLEDEPERASYYLGLYREAMARVKALTGPTRGAAFTDVLRWA